MENSPAWPELHQSDAWKALAREFDRDKEAVAAVFASARSVESVLFVSEAAHFERIGTWGTFLDYYAVGPVQDEVFAARLGALVPDAHSYVMPGEGFTLCDFVPPVGFRVWGGPAPVDVILCFGCLQLAALENDDRVPLNRIGGFQGRFRVAGDFATVAGDFSTLALEVFPELEQSVYWKRRRTPTG